MKFPTKLLAPGEEVLLDARPNWSYLFWPAVLLAVVCAGCVAATLEWTSAPAYIAWVLLGCGALAVLYFLARYLGWLTTTFVVTSQRIVYRTGVLRRTGREIPIGRVQDVTFRQTIVERIVRAGSLTVESAGRHGQDPFPDISRPAEVQSLINRIVAQAPVPGAFVRPTATEADQSEPEPHEPITEPTPQVSGHTEGQGAPAPPPSTPPPPGPTAGSPSVAQQMQDLAELHRRGIITEAEYERKRRELLERL